MRRTQLNIALGVALLALGVGVYLSRDKEEKKPPLTALTAETIDRIAIEHPDKPAIKLEKKSGEWWLTEPVSAQADKFEVNGVLSLATLEQKTTLKAAEVKATELGLEPPAYAVTLNDVKLELGGLEPIQYQRYIRVGDTVALTDDPPSAALDANYSDLVSKSILPENAEVTKLELPGLTLAKDAAGKWQATPPQPQASADGIQKLVDGWKNARALWNELDESRSAGGEAVTITLKDQTLRFVIAARDPQFQLARPELGVKFNLSKALADELLKISELPKEEPKPENPVDKALSPKPATSPK